jgi:hypothetical protein
MASPTCRAVGAGLLWPAARAAARACASRDSSASSDQPHHLWVVSLFPTKVNIYEVQNNGNRYYLGFMLGVSSAFGSGGWAGTAGTRRLRKRTSD